MNRWWRRCLSILVVGTTAVVACMETELVECGDQLCPFGSVCIPGGCATVDEAAACAGVTDGQACVTTEILDGTCFGGGCRAVECGNGAIDHNEVCDDGNVAAGDECSQDCRSDESCDNGVVDTAVGEQCDVGGVKGLAGDGCSSSCKVEVDVWRDVTPPAPRARGYARMAPDRDGHVVLFGGQIAGVKTAETWQWDGQTWIARKPVASPPARIYHGLAYDEARRETVLFGGIGASGELGDTWVWNGITWTERLPSVSPSARYGAHLAYDPDRQQVVMFGGQNGPLILDETWLWNGSTWTKANPATSPPPLLHAPLAFHPTLRRVVMYGGYQMVATSTATWSWNGVTWAQESFGAAGTTSDVAVMASDATGIVLGNSDMVWRLDGSWSQITSNTPGVLGYHAPTGIVRMSSSGDTHSLWSNVWVSRPAMQAPGLVADSGSAGSGSGSGSGSALGWGAGSGGGYSPRMVYDALRGRTIAISNETWEWDGLAWRRRTRFSPVCLHAAFDSARGVTMCIDTNATVWTWNGLQWQSISTPLKPPVGEVLFGATELTFETARGVALLVGGKGTGLAGTQTWQWDGASWSLGSALPLARMWHATATDLNRGRVVVFGGKTGSGSGAPAEETLEWDGTAWSVVPPMTPSPGTRLGAVLVYAPNRQEVILFGGGLGDTSSNLNDTWRWNGTWTQLEPLVAPPRGGMYTAAADVTGVLLLGANGKTWRLESTTPFSTYESCTTVDDLDGDGFAGCDDPDCWTRCTPLCPPSVSCASATPRCGDTVCGSVEDYLLCPVDCTEP